MTPSEIEDPCLVCGGPSDYGCHGIHDGAVYSEHYCEEHWLARKDSQRKETRSNRKAREAEFEMEMATERERIDWALIPEDLRKKLGK